MVMIAAPAMMSCDFTHKNPYRIMHFVNRLSQMVNYYTLSYPSLKREIFWFGLVYLLAFGGVPSIY